jgi:aspartyl aminopeptidase
MGTINFNKELLSFLSQSPTPYHAVLNMSKKLLERKYIQLHESTKWNLREKQGYFVVRSDASLIAFHTVDNLTNPDLGMHMIGAHTDSPCLKVKPNPCLTYKGYFSLALEVYGGVLLNPWFDRDLSIAGQVSFCDKNDNIQHKLIDFKKPIAVIPSLAIHLDREANKDKSINPQTDIPAILTQISTEESADFNAVLITQIKAQYPDTEIVNILSYDLCLYDTLAPAMTGLHNEFISSARLDNLISCFAGLESLLETKKEYPSLLVCNNHEEVGSTSESGADGPFLKSVLERIYKNNEQLQQILSKSILISADNAHGVHPNYKDKHDSNHTPILNQGPVIKINNNQRYASNNKTISLYKQLCQQENIPTQTFVTRSDMGCGSTIGPITSAKIGVQTLDVGIPTFAMHSIRELAGSQDTCYLTQSLTKFLGMRTQ